MRAISLTLLCLTLFASVANTETLKEKKPKYMPAGFRYVGSDKPIPSEHIKCMKFLDDYLVYQETILKEPVWGSLPPNEGELSAAAYKRIQERHKELLRFLSGQGNAPIVSTTVDWNVPPKEMAAKMAENARSQLKEHKIELEESLKERQALLKKGISKLQERIEDWNVEFIRFKIRFQQAYLNYAECVVANDLPSVTD